MRSVTFLARRFAWRSHVKTLEDATDERVDRAVEDAVVAFLHVEATDHGEDQTARLVRRAAKHLKWLANKRGLRAIVLHSFTHLGAQSATPEVAQATLDALAARLRAGGYEVEQTPFGWFTEWDLSVHGDSLAKVYKDL